MCSTTVVASSSARIDAFATDGVDVYTIEAQAARACSIASATPDACREIVTGEQVGQRLFQLATDFGWGGKNRPGGPGGGKNLVGLPALSPKAIALQPGRVLVADDQYKVVVSCPTSGTCTSAEMGLVETSTSGDDDDDAPSVGRSLALSASAVVWTQGDEIRGAPLPGPGGVARALARRSDDTTQKTARLAAPGTSDLLWLSDDGLHYASAPNAAPERWFARPATDFSFDAERVYLAGPEGLFRLRRTDKSAALSAPGSFEHVAVDDRGVYATMLDGVDGGRTLVVEARAEKPLELAVVDGPIDGLAVAGDHVYFMVRAGAGSEIRRVAR